MAYPAGADDARGRRSKRALRRRGVGAGPAPGRSGPGCDCERLGVASGAVPQQADRAARFIWPGNAPRKYCDGEAARDRNRKNHEEHDQQFRSHRRGGSSAAAPDQSSRTDRSRHRSSSRTIQLQEPHQRHSSELWRHVHHFARIPALHEQQHRNAARDGDAFRHYLQIRI